MSVPLRLTFMSGSRDGEVFQVLRKEKLTEVVIGRSEDCAVCLSDDPELSRRHARLSWNEKTGDWQLEDMNSTNGTYIGEFKQAKRVSQPVSLVYGDIFRVGRTCLRLEPPIIREVVTAAEAYAETGK